MDFQKRIEKIGEYFKGIDYFNDALMVKVQFPKQVTVSGDAEKGISVAQAEDGLWYYYGNKHEVNIEDIFDLIDTTVYVYEEAKKKAELYKMKCEELRDIFGTTPYEKLVTLEFVFKSPKKTRSPKKKKEENEANAGKDLYSRLQKTQVINIKKEENKADADTEKTE